MISNNKQIYLIKKERYFRVSVLNYLIYDESGKNIISKMMFLPNDTEIIIHELNNNPKLFKAFIPKLSIFIDNIGFDEVEILI